MSKLRATTKEEQETHVNYLKGLRLDQRRLEEGYKVNLISKAQMKKGIAKCHNDKVEYLKQNKLEVFMGYLYVREDE